MSPLKDDAFIQGAVLRSCVETSSLEYRSSAECLMTRIGKLSAEYRETIVRIRLDFPENIGPRTISRDITLYIHVMCKQKDMDNTDPILGIMALVSMGICGVGICFYVLRGAYLRPYRVIPLEHGEQYA